MPRGTLRVYLGVAPGAGTTHALLDEAGRRRARGTDVVLGAVDAHGRAQLEARAGQFERIGDGRRLDVEALIGRRPSVVVVDDLDRPNPSGAATGHRWQDVEALLDAGMDVLAGLDVRGVASLADTVEQITGERPTHTVPDRLLQDADQLELVDIAPQALRRRLAHGALYPPEQIDAARAALLRPAALAGLRELALAWAAGTVPLQHDRWVSRAEPGHEPPPVERERVLVALSGGPESEALLHRAAGLAARAPGTELLAVHVLAAGHLAPGPSPDGTRLRDLAESVGAAYQQVIGEDVAAALVDVARAEHATQLVLGVRLARSRWGRRSVPGTATRVLASVTDGAGPEVHVVPAERAGAPGMPPVRPGLGIARRVTGAALAIVLPAALTVGLQAAGNWLGLAGHSLLFLLAVVVTALVGGLGPALLSAVVGSTLLNYYFIPPVHTFRVAEAHNALTLVVFVLVGAGVGAVVNRAAELAAQAARASAESRTLAAIAGGILSGSEALPALLEQVRTAFGMTSASLLQRRVGGARRWEVVGAAGPAAPTGPEEADVRMAAGEGLVLALSGRTLAAADRTILAAFASRAEALLERDRLARSAAVAARLEATERLRDALLAAVGHDLRTPLASATAAVTSLRSADVAWSPSEREELLATAEESLHRLARLVADLLDLSRLRAGVLTVASEPVWLDEVIPPALDELGPDARDVVLQLPDDLPAALADGALVTRVVVNLVGNALRYSPPGRPPLVAVSSGGSGGAGGAGGVDRVQVRVVDRGPGIPAQDLPRVFTPFQRLGDTDNSTGLGLGLALSRGLVEAMGGTLEPDETPGGGLTMVVTLPAAPAGPSDGEAEPGQRERGDRAEARP